MARLWSVAGLPRECPVARMPQKTATAGSAAAEAELLESQSMLETEAALARSRRHGYQLLEPLLVSKSLNPCKADHNQCQSGRSEHGLHNKGSDENHHSSGRLR